MVGFGIIRPISWGYRNNSVDKRGMVVCAEKAEESARPQTPPRTPFPNIVRFSDNKQYSYTRCYSPNRSSRGFTSKGRFFHAEAEEIVGVSAPV